VSEFLVTRVLLGEFFVRRFHRVILDQGLGLDLGLGYMVWF